MKIAVIPYAFVFLLLGTSNSQAQRLPPGTQPDQGVCDPTLWQHVYAGQFDTPQDRLRIEVSCISITGVIDSDHPPRAEKDGDWHIRLTPDPPFASLLNERNISAQFGDLVVEPVCSNRVTQRDTLDEGVCERFQQRIFDRSLIGQHVQVTGAYVMDMDHGWMEIHPVTSIFPIP